MPRNILSILPTKCSNTPIYSEDTCLQQKTLKKFPFFKMELAKMIVYYADMSEDIYDILVSKRPDVKFVNLKVTRKDGEFCFISHFFLIHDGHDSLSDYG